MKISVITVCFNAALCIEETIKSVINQKYNDFEYIIVDGKSTDGTIQIIEKYQSNISKWISEPDNGIYNAMNKAVKMANGEYCIFMNAGDMFLNPLVLKQVSLFLEDGFDYLAGNEISVKNGKMIEYVCAPEKITTQLFVQKSLSHQASFIKRQLLLQHPYDENLRMVSDWKFCIQTLIFEQATYRAIDVDVCKFNHEGITFKQMDLGRKERLEVLQELLPKEFETVCTHPTIFSRIKKRYKRKIEPLQKSVSNKLSNDWKTFHSIVSVLGVRTIPVVISKLIKGDVTNKIKHQAIIKFLDKKYAYVIHNNKEIEDKIIQIKDKYPIWVCWWQGEKFMPLLPKVCLQYLKRNLRDDQCLHLITKDNFSEYVQLPQHTLRMLNEGKISITNFSDILRFALLTEYGGLWIDATCLTTNSLPNLSDYMFFTSKQHNKGNHFVSQYRWASYLIGGKTCCIFQNMRDLFYEYTTHEKAILDYLLADYFMAEIYKECKNAQLIIDQFPHDNYDILEMTKQLSKEYKETLYNRLTSNGSIHKLNRKNKYPVYTENGLLTIWGSIIDKL